MRGRRWTFHDVDLELSTRPPDAQEREASRRELGWVLYQFKYRDKEARRVVLEIYASLRGRSHRDVLQSPAFDFGMGDARADALGDELLAAARVGRLIARKRTPAAVALAAGSEKEDILGPEPPSSTPVIPRSWIGLVLIDQDSVPMPAYPYRVIGSDGTVYEGQLDSNGTAILKDVASGECQVSCPSVTARPALTYVVKSGEYLSGIAATYGFDDCMVVWNRPENADLRSARTDPEVLAPGDELFIPELRESPVSKTAGTKYTFTIRRTPLWLKLELLDPSTKPVAGAPLTVDDDAVTTDGDGRAVVPVDKSVTRVSMVQGGEVYALDVGGLDPMGDDPAEAYKARLFNLGFLWDRDDADDNELEMALQDFQAEYDLPLSGELDDPTKAKIQEVHGA